MEKLFLQPTRHFHCETGLWRDVFSISWTARPQDTPDSNSYHGCIIAVQQIVYYLSQSDIMTGDVRIGMVPFAWRSPLLTAKLMRDCLRHLFIAVRDYPRGNTSLHVSVRSITEFRELTDLLTCDLPVKLGPLGFPRTPWVPDDSK
jgi:hypothetical protein